jgi:hypothetical protein
MSETISTLQQFFLSAFLFFDRIVSFLKNNHQLHIARFAHPERGESLVIF